MSLTPTERFELAQKISQMMDEYFAEKQCSPDEEVLLLALYARTNANYRGTLLTNGAT